jgi:hypothetical protein
MLPPASCSRLSEGKAHMASAIASAAPDGPRVHERLATRQRVRMTPPPRPEVSLSSED